MTLRLSLHYLKGVDEMMYKFDEQIFPFLTFTYLIDVLQLCHFTI